MFVVRVFVKLYAATLVNETRKKPYFVNVSAKTKNCWKIFWGVVQGQRYYRFMKKNQSSKLTKFHSKFVRLAFNQGL